MKLKYIGISLALLGAAIWAFSPLLTHRPLAPLEATRQTNETTIHTSGKVEIPTGNGAVEVGVAFILDNVTPFHRISFSKDDEIQFYVEVPSRFNGYTIPWGGIKVTRQNYDFIVEKVD